MWAASLFNQTLPSYLLPLLAMAAGGTLISVVNSSEYECLLLWVWTWLNTVEPIWNSFDSLVMGVILLGCEDQEMPSELFQAYRFWAVFSSNFQPSAWEGGREGGVWVYYSELLNILKISFLFGLLNLEHFSLCRLWIQSHGRTASYTGKGLS